MAAQETVYRATNLREVIRQQGRSLTWLAQRCRVSRPHLSRICTGERGATPDVARLCSDTLGVPVALLFERVHEDYA